MRDNLPFYGIAEKGQYEDCEDLVKGICYEQLDMREADELKFDRVHRVGAFSKNKVRPIVAKFHYHKEREIVRQRAYECSETLKRENIGVGQQWPSEVRETRKALFPIMQREKSQGKQVKLVKDKLYINDVEYKLTSQERYAQQSAPQTSKYTPAPPPHSPLGQLISILAHQLSSVTCSNNHHRDNGYHRHRRYHRDSPGHISSRHRTACRQPRNSRHTLRINHQ